MTFSTDFCLTCCNVLRYTTAFKNTESTLTFQKLLYTLYKDLYCDVTSMFSLGLDFVDPGISFWSLHGKPYFLFPDVLKRWSFQKNPAGTWSFLYYRERWYFFFLKIWPYTLGGKWKMFFLKKKYTEIWYFLQTFWKVGLFKKGRAGTWSFLYCLRRWYFSPQTRYFFLAQKVRDDLPQEIRGNMIFSVYTCGCYKHGTTPLCQKNQKRSYPAKIYLKVIDVLDRHLRKSSSNSLYSHGGRCRRFYVALSSKKNKNRKLNI